MPPEPDRHEPAEATPERTTDSIAGGFAARIRNLHEAEQRGDLAALRRMDPAQPFAPAFQRMLVQVAPRSGLDRARRMALLAKILALPPSGEALADGRRALGTALFEVGATERRVQVLMNARGEALDDAILRLSRRIARSGALPFFDLGRLILGGEREVETTRYRIARDYWTGRATRDDAIPTATGDTAE